MHHKTLIKEFLLYLKKYSECYIFTRQSEAKRFWRLGRVLVNDVSASLNEYLEPKIIIKQLYCFKNPINHEVLLSI